jgi:hypothetical protein
MKRDLEVEPVGPSRRTSTLTKRAARTGSSGKSSTKRPAPSGGKAARPPGGTAGRSAARPAPGETKGPAGSAPGPASKPPVGSGFEASGGNGQGVEGNGQERAPDVAENDGMSPVQKPKRPAKARNRRHGRPR